MDRTPLLAVGLRALAAIGGPCHDEPPVAAPACEPTWRWVQETLPTAVPIDRFEGTSPDDVWAFGVGTLLHYDGTTWVDTRLPIEPHVHCCALERTAGAIVAHAWTSSSPYTAGCIIVDSFTVQSWSFRLDDGGWVAAGESAQRMETHEEVNRALARFAPAAPEVRWEDPPRAPPIPFDLAPRRVRARWRIGDRRFVSGSGPEGILEYDGARWRRWTHVALGPLVAVRAWATDDVWVLARGSGSAEGAPSPPEGEHALLHWDGATWTRFPLDGPVQQLWGLGPDRMWAIGPEGSLAYDGTRWSASTLPDPTWRIGGTAPGDLWVAPHGWVRRESQQVLHGDGSTWRPVPFPTDGPAPAFFAVNVDRVWGYSSQGLSAWDGQRWQRSEGWDRDRIDVRDLWASGRDDAWAVGSRYSGGNVALHFTGGRWAPVTLPSRATLYSVWGRGPDDVWMTGDDGLVLHWDGHAWVTEQTGTHQALIDIEGAGDELWAVGAGGTILRRRKVCGEEPLSLSRAPVVPGPRLTFGGGAKAP